MRGRLLGAVGLAVLCFLGALTFNELQMRRIGAALQVVDTVYLPLARLSARMSVQPEPELVATLAEARALVEAGQAIRVDGEEQAARAALLRQIENIAAASPRPAQRDEVRKLSQLIDGRIAAVSEKAAQAQGRAERISVALLGMAVALGAALLWLTGSALAPVTQLTGQVRRVAAGERAVPLSLAGNDEIAALAGAFDAMTRAVEERDRNLQELSLYLRRVLDSITAAVAVVEGGTVRMANPAAYTLWHATEGAALPLDLDTLAEGRHEGLPAGERTQDVVVLPFGEQGRILVGEDVTDRLRDRERLQRSERLALVGQMLAQVTHEVRNPLNAMSLHAELLTEEVPPAAQPLLHTVIAEIRRLEGVTERYLDLARRRAPELAPEDPVALARGVVALEEEALRRAGITAGVEGEPGQLVDLDGNVVRRALLNLVRNAGEAGASHITVRVSHERGALRFEVEDDGPGMEPDVAARIFDPFFSTRSRGTGLGLAITRQTIEDLGGSVRVETAPGKGTRFVLRLDPVP